VKEGAVRKLILKMSVSIDGFVAGPTGRIDWLFNDRDPTSTAWTLETVWNASLHLMGSRTFHDMMAFWPTSTEVYAAPMNQIPKAVFSKQGLAILERGDTTAALQDAARAGGKDDQPKQLQPGAESWGNAYVASGDLRQEIEKLKAGDGKPMVAHGGASFARSLIAQGLVDEYHLLVHPVALGKGLAIFSDLTEPRRLQLMKSIAFPAGSMARLYRPA
jgi:dihydrofolate reductase